MVGGAARWSQALVRSSKEERELGAPVLLSVSLGSPREGRSLGSNRPRGWRGRGLGFPASCASLSSPPREKLLAVSRASDQESGEPDWTLMARRLQPGASHSAGSRVPGAVAGNKRGHWACPGEGGGDGWGKGSEGWRHPPRKEGLTLLVAPVVSPGERRRET